MSEVDVTISKQTFMVVLYPLRRPKGQQFCNMIIGHALFFLETSPKVLIIKHWSYREIAVFINHSFKVILKQWKASMQK